MNLYFDKPEEAKEFVSSFLVQVALLQKEHSDYERTAMKAQRLVDDLSEEELKHILREI